MVIYDGSSSHVTRHTKPGCKLRGRNRVNYIQIRETDVPAEEVDFPLLQTNPAAYLGPEERVVGGTEGHRYPEVSKVAKVKRQEGGRLEGVQDRVGGTAERRRNISLLSTHVPAHLTYPGNNLGRESEGAAMDLNRDGAVDWRHWSPWHWYRATWRGAQVLGNHEQNNPNLSPALASKFRNRKKDIFERA
jgi:hypothetical protein